MKLACFVVLLCPCLWAQTPVPEAQTLQTLLAEVHQLRLALERSSQIAPRIQIAVERIKMQQDQASRTARQLDDVRSDLDKRRADQAAGRQRLDNVQQEFDQTSDVQRRKELTDAVNMFKLQAEQTEKTIEQLQAREGELAGQLQVEQSKLAELNDRLDRLERVLGGL